MAERFPSDYREDMLRPVILLVAALFAASGCASEPEGRRYPLKGQILAIDAPRRQVLIKHGDIVGFMPGMTMMFSVRNPVLIEGKVAGDLVTGTLVVSDTHAYLSALDRIGHAPVEAADAAAPAANATPVLENGEAVPEQMLLDQDGRARRLADWKGQALAVTFIYTRCPMPEFCPRMDRQFAEVQRAILASPQLAARARLLSISFDPAHDTPAVLRDHAQALGAVPAIWTFAAPPEEQNVGFAGRFGVYLERSPGEVTLTHNLRTAIVSPQGRVVKIYSGSDWTPAQVLSDLKALLPTS